MKSVSERLDEIAALEDGWYDGNGHAIDLEVIEFAREHLERWMDTYQISRPGIFPGVDERDLHLEWNVKAGASEYELCLEIVPGILGNYSCTCVKGEDEPEYELYLESQDLSLPFVRSIVLAHIIKLHQAANQPTFTTLEAREPK